ncbi:MAG: ABC transporter substrate-binding protein [Alphaproteobacteria bacterium]|nr:ABC transporter substrate-binding protein [Alphaproteobacteria bacterium]
MESPVTRWLIAAAALLLAAQAHAAPMAASIDQPVTISFYDYNLATPGLGGDATRELNNEFMAANPKIKVEGVGVPPSQLNARVQADIAVGRRPDLAQLGFDSLDFNVHQFGIQPLDELVPADELKAHLGGMVPAGVELGRLDDKLYGLAFTFSTPVLFYNATLFRAAGLDPDAPPRDFGAVQHTTQIIHEKTGKGGFYTTIFDFDYVLQGLVLSNGGRTLSEDRKTLRFDDPALVDVLRRFQRLAKVGAFPNVREAEIQDVMGSGSLGMLLTTSAYQRYLLAAAQDKWELRAAPMPSFGDKPTHPTNSGSALFILAEDPVKQRAAWELAKFLTSKHGYTIITSKIGYLPLRLDIVDDPQYLGPWVKANPLIRPNLEQLTRLSPWQSYPGANYKQIQKILLSAVSESIYGTKDPEAVMHDAQARASALMPR